MPPVSEAQRRWAWSNKGKKTAEGRAAKEFADADPGGKLPARAPGTKEGRRKALYTHRTSRG